MTTEAAETTGRDDLTLDDGVDEEVGATNEEKSTEETEEITETTEEVEDSTSTDPRDEEIAQLRKMLSTQHSAIKEFKQHQEQLEKRLKGEIEDPEGAEAAQVETEKFVAARHDELDGYLEVMRINPKYEDVDDVCSQDNVDKLIHVLASKYVAEKGGELLDAMDGIAGELWSARNPYTTMYAMVKQHVLVKPMATTQTEKKFSKTGIKPGAEAPTTLGGLPAGSTVSGGWTTERIDGLSESELHTVPPEVYEKYLKGTLN
jgi:hypothetical protein